MHMRGGGGAFLGPVFAVALLTAAPALAPAPAGVPVGEAGPGGEAAEAMSDAAEDEPDALPHARHGGM